MRLGGTEYSRETFNGAAQRRGGAASPSTRMGRERNSMRRKAHLLQDRYVRSRPRLYSRIGFVHEYRSLTPEELTAVLAQYMPASPENTEDGLAHATAVATIIRITRGNFRLLERLFPQITRVLKINQLDSLTPEIVDAARETLLIGH